MNSVFCYFPRNIDKCSQNLGLVKQFSATPRGQLNQTGPIANKENYEQTDVSEIDPCSALGPQIMTMSTLELSASQSHVGHLSEDAAHRQCRCRAIEADRRHQTAGAMNARSVQGCLTSSRCGHMQKGKSCTLPPPKENLHSGSCDATHSGLDFEKLHPPPQRQTSLKVEPLHCRDRKAPRGLDLKLD